MVSFKSSLYFEFQYNTPCNPSNPGPKNRKMKGQHPGYSSSVNPELKRAIHILKATGI